MDKIIRQIVLLSVPVALAACEETLPFNPQDENYNKLVLNVCASTDAPLRASVSRSMLFSDMVNLYHLEPHEGGYDYETYIYEYTLVTLSPNEQINRDHAIVEDATVTYSVNGGNEIGMEYDPETGQYVSSYVPKASDRIEVRATSSGFKGTSARTTVPNTQPFELLSWQKDCVPYVLPTGEPIRCDTIYDPNPALHGAQISNDNPDFTASDTLVTVKLRFSDPPGERNYYRLWVRNVSTLSYIVKVPVGYPIIQYYDEFPMTSPCITDIFTSDDEIFCDPMMYDGFGLWGHNFSNIFSDELFDGQTRDVTIVSRQRKGTDPYMVIQLQSLSPDMYFYLKSAMHYMVNDADRQSESIRIHSNTDVGTGIVGSLNAYTHIIELNN